jgi:hypothetical protein
LTDLKTQLPASSTFQARNIATSPGKAVSITYDFPLKILVSRGLPFSNIASGVNLAGISPVSTKVSGAYCQPQAEEVMMHEIVE